MHGVGSGQRVEWIRSASLPKIVTHPKIEDALEFAKLALHDYYQYGNETTSRTMCLHSEEFMMLHTVETSHVVPWAQVSVKARGKTRARVEFHFTPQYVKTFWHPRTAREAWRAPYMLAERSRLLLDDVALLDGASMFVKAWLVPASEPQYYHLHVTISAPEPLKRGVRVRLYWDKGEYVAVLRAGEWQFEDITEPAYSERNHNLPSRRLRLSLEIEKSVKNTKA
jgi:hypothetical protein